MTKEDLPKQIKELNQRIAELENMMAQIMAPVREMQKATGKYLCLVDLALSHGGLSPEMVTPEVKDPISKDIMKVLMEKRERNISQITEALREKRGSASRRIVRERVKKLMEMGLVEQKKEIGVSTYSLSEEVLRKWSHLLGISI